jgi:hypothetical protein
MYIATNMPEKSCGYCECNILFVQGKSKNQGMG